jgi:serine/threonine protein phosphatase 1
MICLKGNHETYIEAFLKDAAVLSEWRQLGGLETLLSYGVAPSMGVDRPEQARMAAAFRQLIPESHLQFLGNLKSSVTVGDYFFVHAGVRPGIPLQMQRDQDLLWIRGDFLLCEKDFGKTVVHGHTPVRAPESRFNRINIDTGAYATGQLTCLILEGTKRDFIQSFLHEQSTTEISAESVSAVT